ncbi:geranylgeranylglyceryl/heptaprenylglyceryl phosphate synthase [Seonamhaeicola sp.]|uniref:geranylgeranylglyceryl/heptaprenylglyceryl phosphate synthase n=1 Tax=Seonamhaeicola sp. TaxID=1912245 RepID=UPI00356B3C83
MNSIYKKIQASALKGEKLLAVLIDPDKVVIEKVPRFISKINQSVATHIFVGGSTVDENDTEHLVEEIKKHTNVPVILFPGDVNQITGKADGLLFLSLISGRDPNFLIGKHVESVSKLLQTALEIIPTGYILIESGNKSAVERVTNTQPMSRIDVSQITKTAKAGELLGMKLIYLEAGSGAKSPISEDIIKSVKNKLSIPLIVGGGIKSKEQLERTYASGANLVVIGTALEEDETFFEKIKK